MKTKKSPNVHKATHQTHRKVSEDLEGGTQEVDEIHQVPGGAAVGLGHVPLIVGQLDELVDLLVELGVNLPLCSVTSILGRRKHFHTLQNAILPTLI